MGFDHHPPAAHAAGAGVGASGQHDFPQLDLKAPVDNRISIYRNLSLKNYRRVLRGNRECEGGGRVPDRAVQGENFHSRPQSGQ